MTLDEWKAQQVKKQGPKFNVRKPGEGQKDDPKWKKATAYKKENEEGSDEEESEEEVSRRSWIPFSESNLHFVTGCLPPEGQQAEEGQHKLHLF